MSEPFTAIITRRLTSGAHERHYGTWLAEVLEFLHGTPGYDGATLLSSQDQLVRMIVIRFRSADELGRWQSLPRRHELIAEADVFSKAELHVASGLESFFTVPGAPLPPPRWKLCVLMIPLVYVLVNATLFVLSPVTQDWPAALRLIPVTSIMTLTLTYVGLPLATRVFASWLVPRPRSPMVSTTSA
jgi:antibiotic biosynthesis monooxygenase (ABM) superfamily enzyme